MKNVFLSVCLILYYNAWAMMDREDIVKSSLSQSVSSEIQNQTGHVFNWLNAHRKDPKFLIKTLSAGLKKQSDKEYLLDYLKKYKLQELPAFKVSKQKMTIYNGAKELKFPFFVKQGQLYIGNNPIQTSKIMNISEYLQVIEEVLTPYLNQSQVSLMDILIPSAHALGFIVAGVIVSVALTSVYAYSQHLARDVYPKNLESLMGCAQMLDRIKNGMYQILDDCLSDLAQVQNKGAYRNSKTYQNLEQIKQMPEYLKRNPRKNLNCQDSMREQFSYMKVKYGFTISESCAEKYDVASICRGSGQFLQCLKDLDQKLEGAISSEGRRPKEGATNFIKRVYDYLSGAKSE